MCQLTLFIYNSDVALYAVHVTSWWFEVIEVRVTA